MDGRFVLIETAPYSQPSVPQTFGIRLVRGAVDRRSGQRLVDTRKAWRAPSANSRRAKSPLCSRLQRSPPPPDGCAMKAGLAPRIAAWRSFASPPSSACRWRHVAAQSSKAIGSVNRLRTAASPSGTAAASHSRRNVKVKSAPLRAMRSRKRGEVEGAALGPYSARRLQRRALTSGGHTGQSWPGARHRATATCRSRSVGC